MRFINLLMITSLGFSATAAFSTSLPLSAKAKGDIDLTACRAADSGRSGNDVYLCKHRVYKLFKKEKEYNREAIESEMVKRVLYVPFVEGMGYVNNIKLPNGEKDKAFVIKMKRFYGKTYMLAKKGHVRSFIRDIKNLSIQVLSEIEKELQIASELGMRDPQFILTPEKHQKLNFIDIHLNGVMSGGHCATAAQEVEKLITQRQ